MATFNELTRTSDYERQSWRDSYNGGKAAGDVTGNVNASLSQERSDFQGATWSGSSSQMGALEYARYLGAAGNGVAAGAHANGPNAGNTSGPGVSGTATPGYSAIGAAGGKQVGAAQTSELPKTTRIMVGGRYLNLDVYNSDGADGEDRWGDVGGSIYGLGVMIGDGWSIGTKYVAEQSKRGQAILKERDKNPPKSQYDITPWEMAGNLWNAADESAADWVREMRAGQTGGGF